MSKKCTKCTLYKPIEQFAKSNTMKDGLQSHCMPCKAEYAKTEKGKRTQSKSHAKWRLKNPTAARSKEWRKNNPHKVKLNEVKRQERLRRNALTEANFKEVAELQKIVENAGFSLDHIIPLAGKIVSGLNMPYNTQVIEKFDNKRKHNWFCFKTYVDWLKSGQQTPFLRPKI